MITPVIPDLKKIRQAENPYSALFDYEQLAKEEEARKQQAQASQQRIMRTNAVGDALRLISEGVTGSMGASIAPRAVNPGIMQASQRFNALEDQSRENMERLRLQDLSMKKGAIDYNLGQQAAQTQRTWEAGQTEVRNKFAAEQGAAERASREKISAEDNASRERQVKLSQEGQIERANIAAQSRIDQITERAKKDVKAAGGFYTSRFDDPTQVEVLSRETVISQFDEIRAALKAKGVHPGSFNYPKVLEQQNKGKISDNDLDKIVQQFPEVYGKLYPQLYGPEYQQPQQRTYNTPLLPGYVPQGNKIPYNGPLRPTGQTPQAQQSPQKLNFKEAVNALSPDARRILEGASTSEDVLNNTRALIEAKYPNATPAEKAELANALYSR